MKKIIIPFLFCLIAFTGFSQSFFTPSGHMDTVYDKTGNKYALRNIMINPGPNPEPQALPPALTTCTAGYFVLHFAPGSGLDGPGSPDVDRRAVFCQLFTDISCFIRSPLNSACHTTTNTNTFVHFYITNNAAAGTLGNAGSFYTFPVNPLNPNAGIAEGTVHKTIVSGIDAYTNVTTPLVIMSPANNFYHGIINMNTTAAWNYSLTTTTVPGLQNDLYTVMLHEAMHALGFNSLISPAGSSLFGTSNNYYSMYDVFLKDYLGNNIITNNNNPCAQTNYSLNPTANVSSLNGLFCNGPADVTTCSTTPHYVGSVNVPLYEPTCFEIGSSLSHFEDMCYPTATPANNNQIFAMCNLYGGLKRFIKEEERYVLCDIGYSVEPTYNSPVAGAAHTYTAGACSGTNIWGVNDGLSNNSYSYVGTFTIGIPTASIMANDAPTTTSISCVSFVYNYPGVTLSVTPTGIVIGQAPGPQQYCGPLLLQYIPKNASGQSGNITYIYAYIPCLGSCNPPNLCNLVQNNSFESVTTTPTLCSGAITGNAVSCWDVYKSTPDYINRNCAWPLQLGNPLLAPLMDSWNGTPNDVVIGLLGVGGPQTSFPEEVIKSSLSAPLVPTNTYVVSFWAFNKKGGGYNSPTAKDMVLTFASAPNAGVLAPIPQTNFSYPAGLNTLADFTLSATDCNIWKHYTLTVVFSGPAQHNCILIGPNYAKSNLAGNIVSSMQFYTYIDDISILPIGLYASFNPPAAICTGASLANLAQYTTLNGVFTGTGVTNSGGTYNFNAAPNNTLAPGSYPIAFTYTSGNGCVNTSIATVNITGIASNTAFCSYNNYTLSAFGYPAGTTYTWLPGAQTTSSIIVSGSVTTTYSLLTSYSACPTATFKPNVIPNTIITASPGPWCVNQSSVQPLGISIPNYTVPAAITQTWSVGSLTVPVISVNYPGIQNPVYTATTSVSGCTNIATYTATWLPAMSLTLTNSASLNCLLLGQSATLTASSNLVGTTYTWQPGSSNAATVVVTPTTSTIYTVSASVGSCANSQTIDVGVGPPVTFTNLPTTWCKNQCITFLENYLAASTPTGGSWNAPGTSVAVVGGSVQTTACLSSTLAPGVYTITYTYLPPPARCWITNQFTVNVVQDFVIQATASNMLCTNLTSSVSISAVAGTSATTTYTWYPGPLIGATQTVSPAATTIYTVFANNGSCTYSNTATVLVSNQCCEAPNQFTSGVVNSGTFVGQYAVNQNLSIYGYVEFAGEFKMAPNVSITVMPGATLTSNGGSNGNTLYLGLHMYSCTDMWNGIIVQNGGKVIFKYGDLIEDAKNAIYSNGCTSTSGLNISMNEVVFNRNYNAIVINNYAQNTANPPFEIKSCVITCRDLNVAPGATLWPTADWSSGLRTATGSTTLLSSPYLLSGYAPANLKVPFSNQPSSAGVYIENCGLTYNPTNVTPTYYTIIVGEKGSNAHSAYNIFDNLMYGIFALNSNVSSFDNVFQYGRRLALGSPRATWQGGYAIYSVQNGSNPLNYNNSLNLVAPTAPTLNINALYDTQMGIYGYFLHHVNADNLSIQSTRNSNVATTQTSYGQTGIFLHTIKTKDYKLNYGRYRNIKNCIQMTIGVGTLNLPGFPSYGGYLGAVDIKNNLFTPATGTAAAQGNGGIDNAIYIISSGIVAGSTFTQAGTNMRIQLNNFDRVMRGVYNNAHSGSFYQCFTSNNSISLAADPFGAVQYGISHVNTNVSVVNTNTITGFNTTNTLVAGVYFSANSNSSLRCNITNTLFQGFQYAGANLGTFWRDNTMQSNARGMSLTNGGIMGPQGSTASPSDNKWIGSWTGTNYNTYTDQFSTAYTTSLATTNPSNSVIWRRTTTSYDPTNNGWFAFSQSYAVPGALQGASNTATVFNCSTGTSDPPGGGGGGPSMIALYEGVAADNMDYVGAEEETAEINKTQLYRIIDNYPNLKDSSAILNNFYTTGSQNNIGVLYEVDKDLTNGNFVAAASKLNVVSAESNIQTNYKSYYHLYSVYHSAGNISLNDSTELYTLAHKCPFIDGTVVYKARALFDMVYQTTKIYNDEGCLETGISYGRKGNTTHANIKTKQNRLFGSGLSLYPNPASDEIFVKGYKESEEIIITITDVSGKLLFETKHVTGTDKSGLKLNLLNGIYFVTLVNSNGIKTHTKLVITK